jgi:hypothetical protein
MTYSISANAGDSTIKTFHLVKCGFNSTHNITGVTNATPVVVTTADAHGLTTGMTVSITGVVGTAVYTVLDATYATPIVIHTSASHLLTTNDTVTITGVTGNTAANGSWLVTVTDGTHFSLQTSIGNAAWVSGGTVTALYNSTNGSWVATSTGTYTFSLDSSVGKGTYASGGVVLCPTSTQYWTDSDIPITALGGTWYPNGISVGSIVSTGTAVTASSLTVQNADYYMSGLVYNPLNIKSVPIDILEAWLDPTVTGAFVPGGIGVDIKYLFSGIITGGSLSRSGNQATATYTLGLSVDTTAVVLPRRLLTTKCTVLFKGPACAYSGHVESCDRTYVACKALGNQLNYGGFRTMPTVTPT